MRVREVSLVSRLLTRVGSLDSPEVVMLRDCLAAFVHTGAGHRVVVDVALDVPHLVDTGVEQAAPVCSLQCLRRPPR